MSLADQIRMYRRLGSSSWQLRAGNLSSALTQRARAFSASLEPLTPPFRKARETGFPPAASLLAISPGSPTRGSSGAGRGTGPAIRAVVLIRSALVLLTITKFPSQGPRRDQVIP
jgi:hypothetical protein